jgi:hypothetical protein
VDDCSLDPKFLETMDNGFLLRVTEHPVTLMKDNGRPDVQQGNRRIAMGLRGLYKSVDLKLHRTGGIVIGNNPDKTNPVLNSIFEDMRKRAELKFPIPERRVGHSTMPHIDDKVSIDRHSGESPIKRIHSFRPIDTNFSQSPSIQRDNGFMTKIQKSFALSTFAGSTVLGFEDHAKKNVSTPMRHARMKINPANNVIFFLYLLVTYYRQQFTIHSKVSI